jgi:DNA modification methylase
MELTQTLKLINDDCLQILPTLPDASIDAVITDPPYAEIERDYGRWTEDAWRHLMDGVIMQVRRVLKPTGSAMFVLQPNHETPGRVRPWLWEFVAKYSREWNLIQDVWWWNPTMMPTTHCSRKYGLMRTSVKMCVWLGDVHCYRDQDAVLWEQADANKAHNLEDRALKKYPSGSSMREGRCIATANERGGSTPFNLIPISSGSSKRKGSAHGAATPLKLCEWWVNYICPKGGLVLDPFSGSGTVGEAALLHGRRYLGIERMPEYHNEAEAWLNEVQQKMTSVFD